MRGRGAHTAQGRQVSDVSAHNRLRTFNALRHWIADPHRKFAQPRGRDQVWEADDRAAFIAAANDLGLPGMAFAFRLAFHTTQRTGDLLGFTEAQLEPFRHRLAAEHRAALAAPYSLVWGWAFIQAKHQPGQPPARLLIPFDPALLLEVQRAIARICAIDRAATPPRLLSSVLVDPATARPWAYRQFNHAWNRVKDHAVLRTGRTSMDQLHRHDLRRFSVVELKRQGFTHDRIAMLTGHDGGLDRRDHEGLWPGRFDYDRSARRRPLPPRRHRKVRILARPKSERRPAGSAMFHVKSRKSAENPWR